MIKFKPLINFLGDHLEFHERMKMSFTICKYLHKIYQRSSRDI